MVYSVVECRRTLTFWRWGKDDYGVWVPLVPPGPPNYRVTAALYGYAFVPAEKADRCVWSSLPQFMARRMLTASGEYATVAVSELARMQTELNAQLRGERNGEATVLQLRDRVVLAGSAFAGMEGVIVADKGPSLFRVLLGKRYLTVHASILQKI